MSTGATDDFETGSEDTARRSLLSRRNLLRNSLFAGGALLVGPGVLAACGSDEEGASGSTGSGSGSGSGSEPASASGSGAGSAGSSESSSEPSSASSGGGSGKKTLSASHPQEPPSWNYLTTGASALMVPAYRNVMESLFYTDEKSKLNPLLATKYEVSSDGLEYTITLRKAKFHDGSDMDADDVVYSMEKNKTATNSNVGVPLEHVTSIEAKDPSTVLIKLDQPSRNFQAALGTVATLIAPKGFFETKDAGKKLVGTGPYVFGEYRPGIDLTLAEFKDYWGDSPHIPTVTHRFMTDENATINALKTGQLDMIGMLLGEGVEQVSSLSKNPKYKAFFKSSTSISYVFMNPDVKEFRNPKVRQAIFHAIDRKPIIEAAVGGYAKPTCLYINDWTSPWNHDFCPYPYDPDKAKQLLAEAGYKDGFSCEFQYLSIAEFPPSYQIIQQQLAKVGIKVTGKSMDLATWLEQVNKKQLYEMSQITTSASIFSFGCKGGRPPLGGKDQCDAGFESYIANNDKILDEKKYVDAMKKMVELYSEMAWVVPLFCKQEPGVADANLSGMPTFRVDYGLPYAQIRWNA